MALRITIRTIIPAAALLCALTASARADLQLCNRMSYVVEAAIQRLLTIAGYDASPIDGIRGAKTDAALALFLQDNKLGVTAAGRADFFDVLIAAAQKPDGVGFAWCNDTSHVVMAALGIEDKGVVTTRGWYRVEPGKCLRPEVKGQLRRLYSFAEAVGGAGQALR